LSQENSTCAVLEREDYTHQQHLPPKKRHPQKGLDRIPAYLIGRYSIMLVVYLLSQKFMWQTPERVLEKLEMQLPDYLSTAQQP